LRNQPHQSDPRHDPLRNQPHQSDPRHDPLRNQPGLHDHIRPKPDGERQNSSAAKPVQNEMLIQQQLASLAPHEQQALFKYLQQTIGEKSQVLPEPMRMSPELKQDLKKAEKPVEMAQEKPSGKAPELIQDKAEKAKKHVVKPAPLGPNAKPKEPVQIPVTVAPWAKNIEQIAGLSLKDIQETQLQKQKKHEQQVELEAQKTLIQEAQKIQAVKSQVAIAASSAWATKPAPPPEKKKSLAEIMADESKVASEKKEQQPPRRFADTVALASVKAPTIPIKEHKPPPPKPKIPAASELEIVAKEDGWNVVASKHVPIAPKIVAKSAPSHPVATPKPPNYSVASPKLAASNAQVNPAFLSWCRTALSKVQGESRTINGSLF
jgi:hypothetical protein